MSATDLSPLGNPMFSEVSTVPLLSPQECRQVIDLVDDEAWTGATITTDKVGGARYDPKVRSVSSQHVPLDDSWPWARLRDAVTEINDTVHRYRITGVPPSDRPSMLRYTAETTDHFRPHSDVGPTIPTRKLTYIVQLSPSSDYSGGDLLITHNGTRVSREQGALVVFPSFLTHVVSPVVTGVRYVLVGWVHGPTFS